MNNINTDYRKPYSGSSPGAKANAAEDVAVFDLVAASNPLGAGQEASIQLNKTHP